MNLLELGGRDRDKLIAIKRNMQSDVDCAMFSVPHWSTDRNNAWELWDELPEPKSLFTVKGIYEICADTNNDKLITTEGDSFADAVSKAWLQRYYNTQWIKKIKSQIIPDDMLRPK